MPPREPVYPFSFLWDDGEVVQFADEREAMLRAVRCRHGDQAIQVLWMPGQFIGCPHCLSVPLWVRS